MRKTQKGSVMLNRVLQVRFVKNPKNEVAQADASEDHFVDKVTTVAYVAKDVIMKVAIATLIYVAADTVRQVAIEHAKK